MQNLTSVTLAKKVRPAANSFLLRLALARPSSPAFHFEETCPQRFRLTFPLLPACLQVWGALLGVGSPRLKYREKLVDKTHHATLTINSRLRVVPGTSCIPVSCLCVPFCRGREFLKSVSCKVFPL
eukprot:GHVT01046838.1.p2 GENE.GHVT01046838.1~~GHVT01046838.1.p2  ORF type:complete len:126 (-),score=13.09 GHVT01046838.1:13-390(-)